MPTTEQIIEKIEEINRIRRLPVVFHSNCPGHIKDESKIGKSICGVELGYNAGNDVFVDSGVLYEVEFFAGNVPIIKEDPYNMCKKCLKKIGYDATKHAEKIKEYGNRYPKFEDFEIIDAEFVKKIS